MAYAADREWSGSDNRRGTARRNRTDAGRGRAGSARLGSVGDNAPVTITLDFTGALALIGALSGVGALAWQIVTWRRSGHRVRVTRTRVYILNTVDTSSNELLCITARNVGTSAVSITGNGISFGRRAGGLYFGPMAESTTLPHRLEPGAEANFFAPAAGVQDAARRHQIELDRLRVYVTLATREQIQGKRGLPFGGRRRKAVD